MSIFLHPLPLLLLQLCCIATSAARETQHRWRTMISVSVHVGVWVWVCECVSLEGEPNLDMMFIWGSRLWWIIVNSKWHWPQGYHYCSDKNLYSLKNRIMVNYWHCCPAFLPPLSLPLIASILTQSYFVLLPLPFQLFPAPPHHTQTHTP